MIRFLRRFWNVAWQHEATALTDDRDVRRELNEAKRKADATHQALIRTALDSVDRSDSMTCLLSATIQQLRAGTDEAVARK